MMPFRVFLLTLLVSVSAFAGRAEIKFVKQPRALYELPRKSLYALGTSDDGGVITILNGNISVARAVKDKTLSIDDSMKTKTSSLIYTNVSLWTEIPLPKDVKSVPALHLLINKTLKEFGYENPGTVPFLLKGTVANLKAHVTTADSHFQISETKVPLVVFGLFTKTNKASPQAPEFSTQMHVVVEARKTSKKQSGVVDEIGFSGAPGLTLFLPR